MSFSSFEAGSGSTQSRVVGRGALIEVSSLISGYHISSHCACPWRRPNDEASATGMKCSLGPGHHPAMKGGNKAERKGISPAELLPKYGSAERGPLWFSPCTIQ